jgi:hypothetical protein
MRLGFFTVSLLYFCACAAALRSQAAPTTSAPEARKQAPAQGATKQEAPKPVLAEKNDYSKPEAWLCRPGRQDACAVDLSTTVITADGKMTQEDWAADPKASIDCIYVYPTVSRDTGGNSDMTPKAEEKAVIRAQFARFASKCRAYAPMYRQVTLAALRAGMAGTPIPVNRLMAYEDVRDAWNYYLEHDNQGRGVVLIGHSQGAIVLTALMRNEIDGKPVQARMVSALLLGTSLPVPKGKDVGGAFQHIPLCHAADQIGCVITYATFRATDPPPADGPAGGTRFGKVADPNMMAACTNPANLSGGSGPLHAYMGAKGSGVVPGAEAEPGRWTKTGSPVSTPFVSVPGMLTAECVNNDNGSYLAVTLHVNPKDDRVQDIAGDVTVGGRILRDWGLHLIDVNVAMGNLLDIVGRQAKAYVTKSH